jgi:hypothetical protein
MPPKHGDKPCFGKRDRAPRTFARIFALFAKKEP